MSILGIYHQFQGMITVTFASPDLNLAYLAFFESKLQRWQIKLLDVGWCWHNTFHPPRTLSGDQKNTKGLCYNMLHPSQGVNTSFRRRWTYVSCVFLIIQIVQYVVNSMSNRFVAYHHLSSFHLQCLFPCFSFPHWREKCQAAKFPTSQQRLQPLETLRTCRKDGSATGRWQRGRGFGEKFRRFLACLTWFASGANQTVMKFHTQSCDAV